MAYLYQKKLNEQSEHVAHDGIDGKSYLRAQNDRTRASSETEHAYAHENDYDGKNYHSLVVILIVFILFYAPADNEISAYVTDDAYDKFKILAPRRHKRNKRNEYSDMIGNMLERDSANAGGNDCPYGTFKAETHSRYGDNYLGQHEQEV